MDILEECVLKFVESVWLIKYVIMLMEFVWMVVIKDLMEIYVKKVIVKWLGLSLEII